MAAGMTIAMVLALALAALIGLSLGALGSGGSIITVPLLVYVAGIPAQTAVGMSLAIVGATSLIGAWLHLRLRHFHLRAALLFGVAGGAGAYFGSGLTHRVAPHVLMLLFSALMFVVGVYMLRAPRPNPSGTRCRPVRCLVAGAGVGVLTGFLGVGGGFLIVPALVLMAGLEAKQAVGTSLAIISLNSFSGLAGHAGHGALDPALTLAFLAFALLGLGAGIAVSNRISDRALKRVFAWVVLAVAAAVAATNGLLLL